MLKAIWFAHAAIVSGFAVSWLSSGTRPPLLVLAAVTTALALVSSTRRTWRLELPSAPQFPTGRKPAVLAPAPANSAPAQKTKPRNRSADRPIAELLDVFRPEDVQRLRSQNYRTAWHRREIDRCQALLQVGESMPSFSNAAMERTLDELLEKTLAFVSYHRENAIADPVVGSGEWMIIRSDGTSAAANSADVTARAAHLQELGSAVATTYEAFRAIAGAPAPAR